MEDPRKPPAPPKETVELMERVTASGTSLDDEPEDDREPLVKPHSGDEPVISPRGPVDPRLQSRIHGYGNTSSMNRARNPAGILFQGTELRLFQANSGARGTSPSR